MIETDWYNWIHPTEERHLESFKKMLIDTKCFEKACDTCERMLTFFWYKKKGMLTVNLKLLFITFVANVEKTKPLEFCLWFTVLISKFLSKNFYT